MNLKSKMTAALPGILLFQAASSKRELFTASTRNLSFYSVHRKDILEYSDKWEVFGDPRAELKIEAQSLSKEVNASGDKFCSSVP
jgi:hypothetical protein